jgi:hypothetical protein
MVVTAHSVSWTKYNVTLVQPMQVGISYDQIWYIDHIDPGYIVFLRKIMGYSKNR